MEVYVFEVWVVLPLLLATLPQLTFVVLYGSPLFGAGEWWREDVGRALFFKSATFAAVLVAIAVRIIHRLATSDVTVDWSAPSEWQDWLGSALYWLALAAICYQLWVLAKRRLRERRAS